MVGMLMERWSKIKGRNNETIKQCGCCIYATIFMSDTVKIIASKIEEVSVTSHAGYGC